MEYGVEFAETISEGPQFRPGLEDDTYATLLQALQADDLDSVRSLHGFIEQSFNDPSRPDTDALNKTAELVTFVRAGIPAGSLDSELSIIDHALNAADDAFFDVLDAICEHEFAEEHVWVQRLLNAILCRDVSGPTVQRNDMLKSGVQNLLRMVRTVIQKHP